jgi:hypothetical protein
MNCSVLGHDVRSKVNESNWKEFIDAEYLSIEKQHSALLLANEELTKVKSKHELF